MNQEIQIGIRNLQGVEKYQNKNQNQNQNLNLLLTILKMTENQYKIVLKKMVRTKKYRNID